MQVEAHISWFYQQYGTEIIKITENTPFSVDLICALAYQESGTIWSRLIEKLSPEIIPQLCTGDTLDWPKRKAFPKNKADLLTHPKGAELFDIARNALLTMAKWVPTYARTTKDPENFCHGFGMFQLDIQHVKTNPDFFLKLQWHNFSISLTYCLKELKNAQARMGWAAKKTLTKREQIYVAIAYNKGKADPKKDFKQGYRDSHGKFYGEYIELYTTIASRVTQIKKHYRVKPTVKALNLRKTPMIPKAKPISNIIIQIPGGQALTFLAKSANPAWLKVEVIINSVPYLGYVAADYVEVS